jgi:hypothetical protein
MIERMCGKIQQNFKRGANCFEKVTVLNYLGKHKEIKVGLRRDWTHGLPDATQTMIFCIAVCCPKMYRFKYSNYIFLPVFLMAVKRGVG